MTRQEKELRAEMIRQASKIVRRCVKERQSLFKTDKIVRQQLTESRYLPLNYVPTTWYKLVIHLSQASNEV
jgi:hypothetical protein